MNTEQKLDFDFSKVITEPIKNLKNKAIKSMFLAIGLSVFMTFGFGIKDSIQNSYVKSSAIESRKISLTLQEIKNMNESDFLNMTTHIMKNSNIYDEKVHYVQAIVAKAEIENFEESMSTERASTLGNILVEYKQDLLKDSASLVLIRKNVMNDLPISKDDSDLFFKYQTLYKTKSIARSKKLEDKMQDLLYSNKKGNNRYNNKYNVYDAVKGMDQRINNTFNTIEAPKPKM